jgi:hypothetical protein
MAVDSNPTNGFLAHLGNINNRLVGTPDLDHMLNKLSLDTDEMVVE